MIFMGYFLHSFRGFLSKQFWLSWFFISIKRDMKWEGSMIFIECRFAIEEIALFVVGRVNVKTRWLPRTCGGQCFFLVLIATPTA